nr:hypothetical protein [Tanacetum cinerariifolium]
MGRNGVVSLCTPRNEVSRLQGFNPLLDYFSWVFLGAYRADSCCYNGLYKEKVEDELKKAQENDKIGSKLDKNEKRGEAEKSQKQLQ